MVRNSQAGGSFPSGSDKAPSKPSATLRRRNPSRQTRASLNAVVPGSDSMGEDDSLDERLTAPRAQGKTTRRGGNNKAEIMVAVAIGNASSTRSSSSSSDGGSLNTTDGYNTPATTANVTPAEPANSRSKRVSASARALALRTSNFALRNSSLGTKRSANSISEDMSPAESSDAALARALQAEEYDDPSVKRPKYTHAISNSTDDNDEDLLSPLSSSGEEGLDSVTESDLQPHFPRRLSRPLPRALPSKPSFTGKQGRLATKNTIPDSDESALSELDSEDFHLFSSDSEAEDVYESISSDGDSTDINILALASDVPTRPARRGRVAAPRGRRTRIRPENPEEARMTPRALRERRKLEKQHPTIKTMWDVLTSAPVINPTPAPQPPGISRQLKSFQLEGLNWMMQQEKSQWKGGLLGDEMGMGKTIQAVSLLMSDYPVGKPSLVVVPPVALMQWQSEIEQYTDGKLKVLVHHGSNSKVKTLTAKQLKSYDVIMISYSGLESMHRKEVKGWKRNDGIVKEDITESRSTESRKAALQKLRFITDRIMLRRVKRDHTASMELPPKRVILHNEFFGEIERDFSSSIMTNTTRQFDTYVSRGVMLNNYANIFGLIMQMRQVANHPDLILKKHAEGGQNVLVCGICDEPAEEPIRSRCRHEFCRQCAKDYIRSFEDGGEPDCPRCHIGLSIDFEQPDIEQEADQVKKNSIINRIKMEDWTSSTKIEMLVYDLFKLRSKKQTHKSIVFSQFTSMLQLVEWRLRRVGFNTVMLDGSMTPAQRQKSIEYFMNNVDVEVFLVSLKAGGVALNLTEASRVFIIDPWWNPAAEWQSADRCHRIGQRRPCVITRLCIEDSVESRMVLLQEKKANMINGTINKDQSEALEKLTPEDMQFLFRGS
ncbi:DNA repair protein rad16 [Emmonsiellopsis sp. PD_33]|nr:DNA repair protein rad16 [Emmonsiellopsis sp. PD_33]